MIRRRLRGIPLVVSLSLTPAAAGQEPATGLPAEPLVGLQKAGDRVAVSLGGEPFTEYRTAGLPVPVLYPVFGPGGVAMTRHFPLGDAAAGETRDHPHHRSLWFAHGDVNGVDFWAGAGRIVQQSLELDEKRSALRANNRWIDGDGAVLCSEERVLRFGLLAGGRLLDFDITVIADHGPLVFGDTKEGAMAIRVAPTLRLRGPVARGSIANSEGIEGRDAWGKRARWVDYSGPVGERMVGVTVMDHPDNPRHPTWWHARDYGLLAANPFGVHDFEGVAAGTGDLELEEGKRLRLRYRFWFHDGPGKAVAIEEVYRDFASAKPEKEKR